MKVFISSVIRGYEAYREAAREAIEALGHQAMGAEDFPAAVGTPQQACLAAVRDADITILLMGERYGDPLDSGKSATHEEYEEAKERKPLLLFVESSAQPDNAQRAFLAEVQNWARGNIRASYSSAAELRSRVSKAVHDYELAIATGPVDEGEMLARASAFLPTVDRNQVRARLELSLASGPLQQVIRPAELEQRVLHLDIQREAMFAERHAVLESGDSTETSIVSGALVLRQARSDIAIDETGTILISQAAVRDTDWRRSGGISAIIEEDLMESLARSILFSAWLLDRVDPLHRLTDIVPVVRLTGGNYMAWQTRAETASKSAINIRSDANVLVVSLTPARRHRRALTHDTNRIVEDLVALLRRQKRG